MEKAHYTEEQLESLIRESADAETDPHLRTCPMCRSKHQFLSQFHRALKDELAKPVDPKIERLAQRGRSNIIQLSPYQAKPDVSQLGVGERTLVLAAQHVEKEKGRYAAAVTFASEPTKTLVRVVLDRLENTYRLFILSEKVEHMRHVLITVKTADGPPLWLVTDAGGVCSLSATETRDWKRTLVLLYTPVATLPMGSPGDTKDLNASVDIFQDEGGKKSLILTSESRHIVGHALFVFDDGSFELRDVVEDQPISLSVEKKVKEIRLFN